MVSVYSDADFTSAYKQKQKIFSVVLATTVAYIALCLAMLLYHTSLPYASSRDDVPQAVVYVASVVYVIFIFPYTAIKYSRIRRYFKILTYINDGLKMEETNYFYTFREKSLQKDNVDVIGCVFVTWNKKRQEWMEREVYLDVEKPLPAFESGDYVRYITQSNFIIQYEILEKHAYEFIEYDEEDEDEENENMQQDSAEDRQETVEGENRIKNETEGEEQ